MGRAGQSRAGEKLYLLDMFPYPSGAGLHVGHPLGYIGTDVLGRYLRMTGHNVLHTIGFDAFGLPAEQYAVQTGTHPRTTTEANIARYRAQLRRLGLGARRAPPRRHHRPGVLPLDPVDLPAALRLLVRRRRRSRARPIAELVAEFAAGTRPDPGRPAVGRADRRRAAPACSTRYRLAYVSEAPVNWCPGLGTVLSNEEVTADGRSELGNFPVFRRNLRQWMMRITAYADRLIDDLDRLDWPESVKAMQRNWIGRSEGARVRFPIVASDCRADRPIEVYTTRPDTLFGATYMVLAPEHPLVDRIVADAWPAGRRPALDRRRRDPGRGGRRLPARPPRASPTWTGRRTRRRPASSPARYAVNPVNGAARSRSSSPTTC